MESANVACKIIGTYKGIPWEHVDEGDQKSQFIHFENGQADPSTSWWRDGNFCCDCNRGKFLPEYLQAQLPRDEDDADDDNYSCGYEIRIDQIIPFNPIYPMLELNERYSQLDQPGHYSG